MKKYLREYGLILALIAVGIIGYLLYTQNKEDILAYSLDLIGQQLIGMVEDADSKEELAVRFAAFKGRVLANQVAPEQVENIAANVLNLSNSGSKLTPEEAELVLDVPFMTDIAELPSPATATGTAEEDVAVPESTPPAARPPLADEVREIPDLEQLGERLNSVIALNVHVNEIAAGSMDRAVALSNHVRYDFENGLRVVVDEGLKDSLRHRSYERFAGELQKLENDERIVWRPNLPDELRRERALYRAEMRVARAVERAHRESEEEDDEGLGVIVSLKHLGELGYHSKLDPETMHIMVGGLEKKEIKARLAQLKTYWEEMADRLEGIDGEHLTANEDFWQHYEQVIEREIEALEQRLREGDLEPEEAAAVLESLSTSVREQQN